jgi:hypothetical protein
MRWRWVVILGCLCVVVVGLILVLLPSTDRVTYTSYSLIEDGMPVAAVESVLGRPPTKTIEQEGMFRSSNPVTGQLTEEAYTRQMKWEGPRARITVFFRDGVVVAKLGDQFDMNETLVEWLLWKVGLQ